MRTILHGRDSTEVERVLRRHAANLSGNMWQGDDKGLVAIDGKTLRHSFDVFIDSRAAHALSVVARTRSFALNILRANDEKNIVDALWENALNFKKDSRRPLLIGIALEQP